MGGGGGGHDPQDAPRHILDISSIKACGEATCLHVNDRT